MTFHSPSVLESGRGRSDDKRDWESLPRAPTRLQGQCAAAPRGEDYHGKETEFMGGGARSRGRRARGSARPRTRPHPISNPRQLRGACAGCSVRPVT